MPHKVYHYLITSGKKLIYSQDELQNRDSVLCGYWGLYFLNERQKGKSVLEVIHNQNVDKDNNDFIINYFNNL